MQLTGRKIILLHDNFSGHKISYKPKHIELVFFTANMTAFVQPCDAGIIRATKAVYRWLYCERALDLDALEERDIWKINLLAAMKLFVQTWDSILPKTIENCWIHTGIVPEFPHRALIPVTFKKGARKELPALQDPRAWDVVIKFAAGKGEINDFTTAKELLERVLGSSRYKEDDWSEMLNSIQFVEEDNNGQVYDEIIARAKANFGSELPDSRALPGAVGSNSDSDHSEDDNVEIVEPTSTDKDAQLPKLPQLEQAEEALGCHIAELQVRRWIIGTALTISEMTNPDTLVPSEAGQVGQLDDWFVGNKEPDNEDLLARAAERLDPQAGVYEDEEDEELPASGLSLAAAMQHVDGLRSFLAAEGSHFDMHALEQRLRRLQIDMRREQTQKSVQTTMHAFFAPQVRGTHESDSK
ncbi:hypothetical protein JCM10908_006293 [Rhodotorula pacifica]|uniref:uncharacterized protein n=1 Tax=Rhodotorula pacifica TaxID=1495444 RepID=UPI00317DAC37